MQKNQVRNEKQKIIYTAYHNLDIKTHHLVVSRASVINASVQPYEESFGGLINKPFFNTKGFFKTLKISAEEGDAILKDAKIRYKGYYVRLDMSVHLKRIYNSGEFNEIYGKVRQVEHNSYGNYLNSFGVDFQKEGFYVVDSGWVGNMQRALKNYFEAEVDVQGFYIGSVNPTATKDKMYGLLFSKYHKNLKYLNKIFYYRRLNWEEVLRAPFGSCMGYDTKTSRPILNHNKEEAKGYHKFIEPLQNDIFDKFEAIMRVDDKVYSSIDSVCAYMYMNMIRHTGKADRQLFINMQQTFCETFGRYNSPYAAVAKPLRKFIFCVKDANFMATKSGLMRKKRIFWI